MSRSQELLGCVRGLQLIIRAGIELQEKSCKQILRNSSLKNLRLDCNKNNNYFADKNVTQILNETRDRLFTVVDGVKVYSSAVGTPPKDATSGVHQSQPSPPPTDPKVDFEIKLTPSDRELLKRLDMEHKAKLEAIAKQKDLERQAPVKAVPNFKSKEALPDSAKERSVPSSRIARMVSFGSLAAGIGAGTFAEYLRRKVGGASSSQAPMFLTKANMDRIVDTLCKVRGAALKIGQLLSIQDESIVAPELAMALQRVRKSADFMPSWQLEKVMKSEIGDDWRSKLSDFEEKPFAAASIGQVHWGKMLDGQEVAIKVQYPGVAEGINSDIDNLVGIMDIWNIFPKGMFIDNVVVVAKRELAWEVDYKREAECTKKFREFLKPYPEFYVPKVIDSLCSGQVFTTEFIHGIPLEECVTLNYDERKYIANKILELVLRELMEFRYMQTDPNWANFMYSPKTKQIMLLDFGATREYPKAFVDKYIKIIKAASAKDGETVLKASREIGMLTGYESKAMEKAHVDAVMILGEVFQSEGEFNFKGRDTIVRIQNLVPTMIDQRLTPPPEEIYSLHRKLSGIFLLCAKLDAPISARALFLDMYNKYKFDS